MGTAEGKWKMDGEEKEKEAYARIDFWSWNYVARTQTLLGRRWFGLWEAGVAQHTGLLAAVVTTRSKPNSVRFDAVAGHPCG